MEEFSLQSRPNSNVKETNVVAPIGTRMRQTSPLQGRRVLPGLPSEGKNQAQMFFVLPCIHDLLARQTFVEKVGFMENVSRDEFKRCRVFWSVQFSQPLNSGQAVGQGK